MRFWKLGLCVAATAFCFTGETPSRGAGSPTYIFEISISGKTWQTGVILNPGVKPPMGKVTNKKVSQVLKGELPDYASDFLDLDPEGKFYIYYDSKSSWRVGTNKNGNLPLSTIDGQVANDGQFWMAGDYDLPMIGPELKAFATGKVKFEQGSFVPKSISGKLYYVSEEITSAGNLEFETKGKPTIVP